jgi:hypothetical protein
VNWAARREGKGSGPKGEQVGGLVGLHGPKGGRDGLGRVFSFFKKKTFFQISKLFKPFSNFKHFKLFSKFSNKL